MFGSGLPARLRVLVTAKATADPTGRYPEPAGAVGVSTDPSRPGWIRLAPIPPDEFGPEPTFGPYDIVRLDARPAGGTDPRPESWRPVPGTLVREHRLKQWQPRRPWLDPYVEESMCRLDRSADAGPGGRSLALVRPERVDGLTLTPAPDAATALAPAPALGRPVPPFTGDYRYRCPEPGCPGHRQVIRDWEFVALQHRLAGLPEERVRQALETTYLSRFCGPDRDPAFFVGRPPGPDGRFQVLGVYWPPRLPGRTGPGAPPATV